MTIKKLLKQDQNTSIDRLLREVVDCESDKDWFKIKVAMLAYILHDIPYVSFRKTMIDSGMTITESKNLRQKIVSQYETNLELKQNILRAQFGDLSSSKIKKLYKSASYDDTFLVQRINELPFFNRDRMFKKIKEKPIYSPRQVQDECGKYLLSIDKYLNYLVHKKLKFIVTSNGLMTDIHSSLVEKGIETYYRITPFYSTAHKENFVKRSIHNQAMRFIEINTTLKRGRLSFDSNSESYVNKIVSFSTKTDEFMDYEDLESQDSFSYIFISKNIEKYYKEQPPVIQTIINHLLSLPVSDGFSDHWKKISKRKSERMLTCSDSFWLESLSEFYQIPLFTIKFVKWRLAQILKNGELKNG